VGDAVRLQEETLERLVRAATDGLDLSKRDIAVLYTFCDFPFYKSLVDAGVKRSEAADVIVDLALGYLKMRARKLKRD
jgi:hypothetical protein